MYGGLTGRNKAQVGEEYGEEQLKLWRRSHNIAPPVLSKDSEFHPIHDSRYRFLPPDIIPDTEVI
jgi:2,3-bisphosphoglycerate-dependent phosphoglycerate mutase